MKPTIQEALQHLAEHYSLTAAEARELVRTPTHPEGLRDRFAMAALTGLCGLPDVVVGGVAKTAYMLADRMLEARGTPK